jgi:hypothetical protein
MLIGMKHYLFMKIHVRLAILDVDLVIRKIHAKPALEKIRTFKEEVVSANLDIITNQMIVLIA